MQILVEGLVTRAAKHYTKFEKYLELIQVFAFYHPEQVMEHILGTSVHIQNWSADQEAAQIGMQYMLRENLVEKLLDFIL